MRDEPAAIGVIRASLCQARELEETEIRHVAQRFGFELLDLLDADEIPQLVAIVDDLDVDAVITPTENHVPLDELRPSCEVITTRPLATYTRGHYQRLGD